MLKYSNNVILKYEYIQLGNNFYKVMLRECIEQIEDNKWSYNEYFIICNSDNIVNDIESNFDIYLEQGKLNEKESIRQNQISSLKMRLSNSDYRIMKCTESFMLGAVLPYDFSQLLIERNAIRDNINKLQEDSEIDELEAVKSSKIIEMCAICQTTITNGIDYNNEHYRLNTTDQINLTSLYTLVQAGKAVPYHADGSVCRMYEPTEMIGLVQTSIQWITYHTTYYNLLKHQIMDMETIEEVNEVVYGMNLKDEYQEIINMIMG